MCSNYRVGICYRIAVFLAATPCKKKKDNHIKLVSTASFFLLLDSTLPFCVLLAVISPRRINYFNCWRVQFVFTDRLYNGLTVSKFFIIFILSVCSIPFCYLIKTPGDHKETLLFLSLTTLLVKVLYPTPATTSQHKQLERVNVEHWISNVYQANFAGYTTRIKTKKRAHLKQLNSWCW